MLSNVAACEREAARFYWRAAAMALSLADGTIAAAPENAIAHHALFGRRHNSVMKRRGRTCRERGENGGGVKYKENMAE